ncbi:hypothetical protein [Nocardioides daphniae]|uniref:LamG domain-containing protein n=1 Tax=Nocardioides daphniae TaxID=402297 RepID=A0A4V1CW76_9ACTN|nr:hypothetical protein [Nocardioides daphniae]QCC76297.1 hypothetical protein E2C04_02050 [Nocardioides daphniae]GGD08207.1 hypothetical protein GCM10007231_03760 [Nocardioides daphniae]
MKTVLRITSTVAAAVLSATLLQASPAQAADPTLTITPGNGQFVGGSRLTLDGHVGVSGRRALVVQRHMGRAGDDWIDVPGTNGYTNADGSFAVQAPASAMWGLKYRVKAGNYASPARDTSARAQEVILTQTSDARVGGQLTFLADTVGRAYTGYRDLPSAVLAGRAMTLQRRVSPTSWQDVATATSDAYGLATFTTTHRAVGDFYRVRLSEWTLNGDAIGWHASFPHRVTSKASRIKEGTFPHRRATVAASAVAAGLAPGVPTAGGSHGGSRQHAWSRYGWGRDPRFRYEWEFGESLSSPPLLGTKSKGTWSEASTGTGRVTTRNGGMLFASDGYASAPDGTYGTTTATLNGASDRWGRWEVRGVTTQNSRKGRKYKMRYELVPVAQASRACGTASIILGESKGPNSPFTFGVRNAKGTKWGRTIGKFPSGAVSVAVQVTQKHITWFVNGNPVGTVRDKAALPKGPMTLRLTFVGDGNRTMDSAKGQLDWARSYSLKYGERPTSKIALKKGKAYGGC